MAKIERQIRAQTLTPFQTTAPTDSVGEDAAKQQSRANYKEKERKRAEKAALDQSLADIYAAGLPRRQQGELNYDVEQLIKKTRDRKIDPNESFEFKRELAKIKGKYAQMTEYNPKFNALATSEDYMFETDEENNPYDMKDEFVGSTIDYMNSDYDPNGPSFTDRILSDTQQMGRAQKKLGYNFTELEASIAAIYDLGGVENMELVASKLGYVEEKNTTRIDRREAIARALLEGEKGKGLWQAYQDSNARKERGMSYDAWGMEQVLSRMPKSSSTSKAIDDREFVTPEEQGRRDRANNAEQGRMDRAKAAEQGRRDRANKENNGVPFELSIVTIKVEDENGGITLTDFPSWKAGDETIEGQKISGLVYKDGKLLPVTVEGGVSEDESLAIAYLNKKNSVYSEGEKLSQRDVINQLKGEESEVRGFNEELFTEVENKLKEEGGFNDDEEAFIEWLGETTEFDLSGNSGHAPTDKFSKNLKTFLKDNNKANFTTESGRKNVVEYIKENFPVMTTRAKGVKSEETKKKETPAERAARIARGE